MTTEENASAEPRVASLEELVSLVTRHRNWYAIDHKNYKQFEQIIVKLRTQDEELRRQSLKLQAAEELVAIIDSYHIDYIPQDVWAAYEAFHKAGGPIGTLGNTDGRMVHSFESTPLGEGTE